MSNKLDDLRNQIDIIDKDILVLLGKRVDVVKKIGKYKKEKGLAVLNKTRWNKILESNLVKAEGLGLSKVFTKKILKIIHEFSLEIQKGAGDE